MRCVTVLMLVVGLFAAGPSAGAAQIAADTFGPGLTFQFNTGVTPKTGNPPYTFAMPFTSAATGRVTGIWLPLGNYSGNPQLDVSILASAGSVPGARLDSWTVTFPAGANNLVHLNVSGGPMLATGTDYWIAVGPGANGNIFGLWNLATPSQFSDRAYCNNADAVAPWVPQTSSMLLAYRVEVPEPTSLALLMLAGGCVLLRRR